VSGLGSRAPAALLVVVLAPACATVHGGQADGPRGVLVVDCPVKDADLVVDDFDLGLALGWTNGVPLRPGVHRIELRDQGYYPFYAEVHVDAGATSRLPADLRRALDPP
jgi:hypothetical protein